MLQHFREQEEELDLTLTKIDVASRELYFYDPDMTLRGIYVRHRAQRRKPFSHFQMLLKGLDKYTPPNRVAYCCVRQASPEGYVTVENITKTMRKIYSEVINERTGKMEIDAPLGAYKDICRRIVRVGKKLGKDIIIHREALPPEYGQQILQEFSEYTRIDDQRRQQYMRELSQTIPLTQQEQAAGASMLIRLSSHTCKSSQFSMDKLQRSADFAAEQLARKNKNPSLKDKHND